MNRIAPEPNRVRPARAFTLIELLVVIGIIAILASIGVPALKGLGQSNLLAAANRQLLDDLAFARLRAISDRTSVYFVFAPTNTFERIAVENNPADLQMLTNLVAGQYRSYAVIAARSVGDQPGQSTPRYLTEWRTLPDGMVFTPWKFDPTLAIRNHPDPFQRSYSAAAFPFPNSAGPQFTLNAIGFDAQGQLMSGRDQTVAISKGSVIIPKQGDRFVVGFPEVILTPNTPENVNFIRLNWLTGRAQLHQTEPEP